MPPSTGCISASLFTPTSTWASSSPTRACPASSLRGPPTPDHRHRKADRKMSDHRDAVFKDRIISERGAPRETAQRALKMRLETIAVHAGAEIDPTTGALAPPLHLSTTFEHGPAAQPIHSYRYIREKNPTQSR